MNHWGPSHAHAVPPTKAKPLNPMWALCGAIGASSFNSDAKADCPDCRRLLTYGCRPHRSPKPPARKNA